MVFFGFNTNIYDSLDKLTSFAIVACASLVAKIQLLGAVNEFWCCWRQVRSKTPIVLGALIGNTVGEFYVLQPMIITIENF